MTHEVSVCTIYHLSGGIHRPWRPLQSFQGRMCFEFCYYNSLKFSVFQGLLTIIRNWFSKAGPDSMLGSEEESWEALGGEHSEGGEVVNFQVEGVA